MGKADFKKRAIVIVLDSAGIGAQPDAAEFGDEGSNTLGNIEKVRGRLDLPNMRALGLANIVNSGLSPYSGSITGSYGKCAELTKGQGHHLRPLGDGRSAAQASV